MEERRAAERRPEHFPVAVMIEGPIGLDGQTLNLSRLGVLVEAEGKIPVTLTIKGERFQGVLVRAVQAVGSGLMTYAIQLTDCLLP
jgi:hypothetical protein